MPAAGRKPFTKDLYSKLETYFRENPGDYTGAARLCGCDPRTAKRAWSGPAWTAYAWAVPLRDVIEGEAAKAQAEHEAIAAQARKEMQEKAERARKLREEAEQMDDQMQRAAKTAALRGLASLLSISDGVSKLAKRVGEELGRGTDAQGNALKLPPEEAMRILNRYAQSTKQLVDATEALLTMDRLKEGLPTEIMGISVEGVSIEDAEREVAQAARALEKARKLGLTVLDGGVGDEAKSA